MEAKRVCLIGAGPSGMSFLFYLDQMKRNGIQVPEVVCYEKQKDWGGIWNFDWRTGTDQFGEPVHGSMYHNLWTNSPKEGLEFPDYTFEQHFGKSIPSYPPRVVIENYLKGRMNQTGNVKNNIQFLKAVKSVKYLAGENQFEVVVRDLEKNCLLKEAKFDFVVVCSGHFSVPNVPEFNGLGSFFGRVMHAHDFRDAREFSGKRVLIVGSRKSAEDIAIQCVKFGCKSVVCTYKDKPMGFNWPPEISERPVPSSFSGKAAHFDDGTALDVDVVILCTGYLNHFPYLEDSLAYKGKTELYPPDLYKGVVWTKAGNNQLMYVGMQEPVYSFTMFDIQSLWCLNYIMGNIKLPEKSQLENHSEEWITRQSLVSGDCHKAIDFQTDYLKELCKDTKYPYDLDVADIYHQWEADKKEDILTYRDKPYASKFTGTMAPLYKQPFMFAFDDSLKTFMNFEN